MWSRLPEPLLLQIFMQMNCEDMSKVCCVCRQWQRICLDEQLWKCLFFRRFPDIDTNICRPIGSVGYREEAKRLIYETPKIESETLSEHTNQVLHVSFAHNGLLFSSCSRDGSVRVWSTESVPTKVAHTADMTVYSWSYTQYSQFNGSDTLLLVSGVHFGAHTASGEIAVFDLEADFQLRCRVLNKPYDIFGSWYTNDYLISSRLHFLGHWVSCSALWLNKASQESESERKPIIKRMFKFYNKNASSLRTVLVADCLPDDENLCQQSSAENKRSELNETNKASADRTDNCRESTQRRYRVSSSGHSGSSLTNRRFKSLQTPPNSGQHIDYFGAESNNACTNESPIRYNGDYMCEKHSNQSTSINKNSDHFRRTVSADTDSADSDFDDPPLPWDEDWHQLSDDEQSNSNIVEHQKNKRTDRKKVSNSDNSSAIGKSERRTGQVLCNRDKLLVFTSGSLTYTPHQIGIKRIKPFVFEEFVTEMVSLSERLEERRREERESNQAVAASPNWAEEGAVAHLFDTVDHTIDLKGHIIGMALSPDHRYLYVNSRSWPENAIIENPLHPPPIAQQIDIHVIDLKTFKRVRHVFGAHKAFTPNDECFFIFLDVSEQYVASGAEDSHGYLWDRHYGLCLARLPHTDVVNSVAFNPTDPEMLITASDDFTLKIWRSKSRMKQMSE